MSVCQKRPAAAAPPAGRPARPSGRAGGHLASLSAACRLGSQPLGVVRKTDDCDDTDVDVADADDADDADDAEDDADADDDDDTEDDDCKRRW